MISKIYHHTNGRAEPATVALVDGITGKAITYRSIQQLLGDDYKLLNRQRKLKQSQSHQRHKAQKKGRTNHTGNSGLGKHLDRLLANKIVTFAQTQRAGSIVLPNLRNQREIIQIEIQARAEQKIPDCVEAQEKYAKQYKVNVHQWSYSRLIQNIKSQAEKLGIVVEEGQQPVRGSPQEKAKEIAICVYRDHSKY